MIGSCREIPIIRWPLRSIMAFSHVLSWLMVLLPLPRGYRFNIEPANGKKKKTNSLLTHVNIMVKNK